MDSSVQSGNACTSDGSLDASEGAADFGGEDLQDLKRDARAGFHESRRFFAREEAEFSARSVLINLSWEWQFLPGRRAM